MRLSRRGGAVRRPVHPGHGRATRPIAPQTATGCRPGEVETRRRTAPPTRLPDGAPVTVGRIEKMSKSKKNVVDPATIIDDLRRRRRAAVHAVRQPARARPRMDRGRHRGRLALRQPPVAAGRGLSDRAWARTALRVRARRTRCAASPMARSSAMSADIDAFA